MAIIGSLWWVWLICFIASIVFVIIKTIKGGSKVAFGAMDALLSATSDAGSGPLGIPVRGKRVRVEKSQSLAKVFGLYAFAGIVAWIMGGLFVLSLIVNLITFFKH